MRLLLAVSLLFAVAVPTFDFFAARARGMQIFPSVEKAALLFGGEGGKGVLIARDANGSWSAPALNQALGAP